MPGETKSAQSCSHSDSITCGHEWWLTCLDCGSEIPDQARLDALADDLTTAGFFIVSHDVRAGRWTPDQARAHVERRASPDGPWNELGQVRARRVLERWFVNV